MRWLEVVNLNSIMETRVRHVFFGFESRFGAVGWGVAWLLGMVRKHSEKQCMLGQRWIGGGVGAVGKNLAD